MYRLIGKISTECQNALLSAVPKTGHVTGPESDYYTTPKIELDDFAHPEVTNVVPRESWVQGICVEILPGGHLHNHTHDLERDQGKTRYHVVLKTNPDCESQNGEDSYFLEERGIYWMKPYLPHESWNHGHTGRIHLILVTLDVSETGGDQRGTEAQPFGQTAGA